MKLEVAPRKFFGRPLQKVKVYCKNSSEFSKLAIALRRLEGVKDCLEGDVRLPMRYLIGNNVLPCWWHQTGGG